MLPSMTRVSTIVHEGDQIVVHAWAKGVADALRFAGERDGMWMWLDDTYDPPEMSIWVPHRPVVGGPEGGSGDG